MKALRQTAITEILSGAGIGINLQDDNADAFILAAGITDATQKSAITNLVIYLKAINEVEPGFVDFDTPANSICLAIYPFVGGSASAHKFNLINPVDTDAGFRLTFAGGITHDEKGIKGNGVDGNVFTHLAGSLIGETSHGFDLLRNGGEPKSSSNWDMITSASPYIYISAIRSLANSNDKSIEVPKLNQYSNSGMVLLNRTSQTAADFQAYISSVKAISTSDAVNIRATGDIGILSLGSGYESKSLLSYSAIRKAGISEAAILEYQAAILTFNNSLGRLQKKNVVFEGHSFFDNQPAGSYTGWAMEQTVLKLNDVYTNRLYKYIGSAISGSDVQDLIDRKSTAVDAYYMSDYEMKNIIPIWAGTNDVDNTVGSGTTTYNLLKSYYDSLITDGWTPIILTMTEKLAGAGQQEAERVIFNNLIRNDMNPDYLIDCDLITELTDSTNATYFQGDVLHLTAAGNEIISDALSTLIASI